MNLRVFVFVSVLLGCSSPAESGHLATLPQYQEILPIVPMKIAIEHRIVELRADGTATIDGVIALKFSGGEVRDSKTDKAIFSVDQRGYLGGSIREKNSLPTRVTGDRIGTDTETALTLSDTGELKQLLDGREIGTYHVTGLTPWTHRTAMMLFTTAFLVLRFEAHGLSVSERLAAQSKE
jgi:hypothetical protein